MSNTSDQRRKIRVAALAEALRAVREIRPPEGQGQVWLTEFTHAIHAASRVLENQIAQAEGNVTRRKRGPVRTLRKPHNHA